MGVLVTKKTLVHKFLDNFLVKISSFTQILILENNFDFITKIHKMNSPKVAHRYRAFAISESSSSRFGECSLSGRRVSVEISGLPSFIVFNSNLDLANSFSRSRTFALSVWTVWTSYYFFFETVTGVSFKQPPLLISRTAARLKFGQNLNGC